MKAVYFEQHGGPEVLEYGEIPVPEPKPGEVLVQVKAAALNHLDVWVRRGWKGLTVKFPHVTGSDIAGLVSDSNGSKDFVNGDRVVVNPGIITGEDEWTRSGQDSVSPNYLVIGEHIAGGLAEFVAVPSQNLLPLPAAISFEQGAAPLLVATTCWRMLFHRASLTSDQTVLVVGSGGGVNLMSLILCKAFGARVIVLAGTDEKAERVRQLGADEVINYHESPDWYRAVRHLTDGRGVNLVVDNVGQATFQKSLLAAARGGTIVTVGNTSGYEVTFDNRLLFAKQLSVFGSTMGSRADFREAIQYLWDKSIEMPIDSINPLSQGIEMLERLEKGKQFGKIILRPGM